MRGGFSLGRLRWLWVEAETQCNSRCVYCNIWKQPQQVHPDLLTPRQLFRILSDPTFRRVEYIINSGGEPTVRSDLAELLFMEHKAIPYATVQLSTNGLLPTRVVETVTPLLYKGCRVDVGVSLDGVGIHHDITRGVPGGFLKLDELLYTLKNLTAHYPTLLRVTTGATLTAQTVDHVEAAAQYAKKLDIPFMFHWFNTSSYYGNVGDEQKALTGKMHSLITRYYPDGLYKEMWLKALETGYIVRFPCHALDTFAVIRANGDVVPCLSRWDEMVGNLLNESPSAVFTNKKVKRARKRIQRCEGCLNNWGVGWSLRTEYWPNLLYKVKRKITGVFHAR